MKNNMIALKFFFKDGATWTVKKEAIGDLWIRQMSTSFGRIGDGDFQIIHPCEGIKVEIKPEADQVRARNLNINSGGLEQGMFDRIINFKDVQKMVIRHEDLSEDLVYFPYKAEDEDGIDNAYQSSRIDEKNGHLYLVIDPSQTVSDVYPEN